MKDIQVKCDILKQDSKTVFSHDVTSKCCFHQYLLSQLEREKEGNEDTSEGN